MGREAVAVFFAAAEDLVNFGEAIAQQAHFLALQGVGKLLETVGLVCRSVNPDLEVSGIVLCMHEGQTTLAKEIVADLEGFFEQCRDEAVPWKRCRLLRPAIRRNIKLAEAMVGVGTEYVRAPRLPLDGAERAAVEAVVAAAIATRPSRHA